MLPLLDHLHITVRDIKRAELYYDKLLPLLGFDISLKEYTEVPLHSYKLIEYHDKAFSFGIVSEREEYKEDKITRRRAGSLHHIAFRVDSKLDVDAIFEKIKAIPSEIIHEPQYYRDYCSDYYAFFFKDSEGNEIELVSFDRNKYFS